VSSIKRQIKIEHSYPQATLATAVGCATASRVNEDGAKFGAKN